MTDPQHILGLSATAEPDEIRRRYLELVRQHPPDRDPQRFAEIRAAYDELSDPVKQLNNRLFEVKSADSLDAIIADVMARTRQKRIPTDVLLSLARH